MTHLDMDGDGVISRSDLKNMLDLITDAVIEDDKKNIIIQSVRLIIPMSVAKLVGLWCKWSRNFAKSANDIV